MVRGQLRANATALSFKHSQLTDVQRIPALVQLSNKHCYKNLTIMAEGMRGEVAIRETEIHIDLFLKVGECVALKVSSVP